MWCPVCGMDGFHYRVASREYDEREYEIGSCSYCGYIEEDSMRWLDDERELNDDDTAPQSGATQERK